MTDVDYAAIAAKIREQNEPPRSDMRQDEWLRAWSAQVIANAMEGLVKA